MDNILLTQEQLNFLRSLQPGVLVMTFIYWPEAGAFQKQYNLSVIQPKDLSEDETIEETTVEELFSKIQKKHEGDYDLEAFFKIV